MNTDSIEAEVSALRAAARCATQGREFAHERIVNAFREMVEGRSDGPTDNDLQSFARLALVERSLHKELGCVMDLSAAQ